MKVEWSTILKTPKNEEIKNGAVAVTLETVAYDALMLTDPESRASGADKLKQARLAKKVVEGAEITVEEASLIKSLVGKYYGPAVVLAVEDCLEGV